MLFTEKNECNCPEENNSKCSTVETEKREINLNKTLLFLSYTLDICEDVNCAYLVTAVYYLRPKNWSNVWDSRVESKNYRKNFKGKSDKEGCTMAKYL